MEVSWMCGHVFCDLRVIIGKRGHDGLATRRYPKWFLIAIDPMIPGDTEPMIPPIAKAYYKNLNPQPKFITVLT